MNKTKIFFISILILGLLPHMQFFPLDVTVSGRWFYSASLGLMGLLGVFIKKKWQNLLIIPIVCFSFITFDRTYDFRNGFVLYSNDIKHDKNNFNLENNLGVEYFRLGNKNKACGHFQRSVDLNHIWWTNYNNLGVCKELVGELDEALVLYKTAIDNGQYYLAYENYAKILVKQGKVKEARNFIEESLKLLPENQELQRLY